MHYRFLYSIILVNYISIAAGTIIPGTVLITRVDNSAGFLLVGIEVILSPSLAADVFLWVI